MTGPVRLRMAATADAFSPPPTLVERRVRSILEVAGRYRTGVRVDELTNLLPSDAPASETELTRWFASHPSHGVVFDGFVYDQERRVPIEPTLDRAERSEDYLKRADRLFANGLSKIAPLIECAGVTGSVAYGHPSEGDDCDFLVITRSGTVWVFLAFTYLRLRMTRTASRSAGDPKWCFNYVLDDRAAREEFARARGFLFAREALTTRVLRGEEFYRGVLGNALWLGEEAPRLFALWRQGGLPPPATRRRAPLPLRWLNALLFPLVSTYLHLGAIRRAATLRRQGREDEVYRVRASLDRLAILMRKFDRLSAIYRPASVFTIAT